MQVIDENIEHRICTFLMGQNVYLSPLEHSTFPLLNDGTPATTEQMKDWGL
jgi:hypothetical protein